MEEIQNNSAETTEGQVDNNLDLGAGENADASNELEFTNSEENTQESVKENEKPKQKTNADYARERRKAEQEKAIKKARNEAIIEALNGVNPYTQEKIEDEADIEEFLNMRAIENSGKDPIADYSRFLKEKAKEKQRAESENKEKSAWLENDRKEFIEKYPDVKIDELIADDLFRTFATGKVGKMSFEKIYTDYQSFVGKSEERARDRAAQVLANNASTPGKLSTLETNSAKTVENMSKAEFERFVEKVKRGEIR